MKRQAVLCWLCVTLLVVLSVSPAFAADPVHADAFTDVDVSIAISGLSANTTIGDRITVIGTMTGLYYAQGGASTTGDGPAVAASGAIGGFGWLAGITNDSGELLSYSGALPVISAAGAVATKGLVSEPETHEGTVLEKLPLLRGTIVAAGATADAPTGQQAQAEATAMFAKRGVMGLADASASVSEDGDLDIDSVAAGCARQQFVFTVVVDHWGQWTVTGGALAAAAAGGVLLDSVDGLPIDILEQPSALAAFDYDIAWALSLLLFRVSFGVYDTDNWKPVGEHIVFTDLPADAWWGDLRRLEMDGRWTYVPPLHPADQMPGPVHADLMIHGNGACTYALRICNASGACQSPRYFTVKWTGSEGVQIYDFAGMATTSQVAASPSF